MKAARLVENEISNLDLLIKAPNVIRLEKVYRTHRRLYIITEACNGGDLEQLRKSRGGFLSEKETRLIMQQVVNGLKHLE